MLIGLTLLAYTLGQFQAITHNYATPYQEEIGFEQGSWQEKQLFLKQIDFCKCSKES